VPAGMVGCESMFRGVKPHWGELPPGRWCNTAGRVIPHLAYRVQSAGAVISQESR